MTAVWRCEPLKWRSADIAARRTDRVRHDRLSTHHNRAVLRDAWNRTDDDICADTCGAAFRLAAASGRAELSEEDCRRTESDG